jgi:hypothetical protein
MIHVPLERAVHYEYATVMIALCIERLRCVLNDRIVCTPRKII